MRLEHIPLIIGAIVALIGLGFIIDASMAAAAPPSDERRRRTRAEPRRAGEAVVGVGTLCMAAALFGRDTWRYGTIAVLVGTALLLIGIVLNWTYLKEAFLFRGPARRAEGGSGKGAAKPVRAPAPRASAPGAAPRPSAPVAAPRASAPAPAPPPAPRESGHVRHPTPPVGSRSYRPPESSAPPAESPAPRAVDPAPRPPAASPPRPGTPPATPPKPPGPNERRKTPRGKK